jgi:hypothetical protein
VDIPTEEEGGDSSPKTGLFTILAKALKEEKQKRLSKSETSHNEDRGKTYLDKQAVIREREEED